MGINAGDKHRPAICGETPLAPRRDQGQQVLKGAAAGGHAATARRQTELLGQPGREAAL